MCIESKPGQMGRFQRLATSRPRRDDGGVGRGEAIPGPPLHDPGGDGHRGQRGQLRQQGRGGRDLWLDAGRYRRSPRS